MPIHAVLLPGRAGAVLRHGPDGSQTAYYDYDVWNPLFGTGADAHDLLPNSTQTDIFCSSQIVLLNGDVEMYGGDNLPAEPEHPEPRRQPVPSGAEHARCAPDR